MGLTNLRFEKRDVRCFDGLGRFDLITTLDAVHDHPDSCGLLAGKARSLKPDGVYLMQDIAESSTLENNRQHPVAPLLYSISCVQCTPASLGQGGPGLGTLWGAELAHELPEKAGFANIECRHLADNPFNVHFCVVAQRLNVEEPHHTGLR